MARCGGSRPGRRGQVRGEIDSSWSRGAPSRGAGPTIDDLVAEVLARADAGERLKDAVADVAVSAGVVKRDLYAAALSARKGEPPYGAGRADPALVRGRPAGAPSDRPLT